MRWILIILLMCNGIYFLWQNYLLQNDSLRQAPVATSHHAQGEGLVLVSEIDQVDLALSPSGTPEQAVADSVAESKQPEAEDEVTAATSQPADFCLMIGPFNEPVSGQQTVSRLASLDIAAELKTIEIVGKPDYWVHMPPQLSRRAAIKLLRELQSNGVDSFLITQGQLENGISLGFFTDQARADRVYEQRVKEGYRAAVKEVPRLSTEIWAVLDSAEAGKLSDALWDKIREGDQSLQRHKIYCDKIASTDDFD